MASLEPMDHYGPPKGISLLQNFSLPKLRSEQFYCSLGLPSIFYSIEMNENIYLCFFAEYGGCYGRIYPRNY